MNSRPMSSPQAAHTGRVLLEVNQERHNQHIKWGEQNHPDGTGQAGDGVAADLARYRCDLAAKHGELTYRHIAEEEFNEALAERDPAKLRAELIQAAAVLVAWAEAIDRRTGKVS